MTKHLVFWCLVLSYLAANALLMVAPAMAHGKEEHDGQKKQSAHMQAMYALKDEIPAEYRIMERTPVLPDEDSLSRGKELFGSKCAVCHGQKGHGDGPAAQSLATPPSSFLDLEHSNIYGPGEKYWIIGNGSGATGMPAFSQVDPIDRWHLVNYILHLQEEANGGGGNGHVH